MGESLMRAKVTMPVYEDARMDPITLYANTNNTSWWPMGPSPSLKTTMETMKRNHENALFLPLVDSVLTLIKGVQPFDVVTRPDGPNS